MNLKLKINIYLRSNYEIEYTNNHDVVIWGSIKVTDLVKLRRFLKSQKIDYRNIIVR